jgi:hypothetical protein
MYAEICFNWQVFPMMDFPHPVLGTVRTALIPVSRLTG